jgi:hypothetical protein
MKKALKKLKRISDTDKVLKHVGMAVAAGFMVGLVAALIRSIF